MPRARPVLPALSAGLATMLLLTAALGVHAVANPGQPVPSESITDLARRSVEWATFPDNSPAALWVVSTSVNAPAPDEFKITYNHGSFALAYEQTAGGPVTSQYTLTVAGLLEWVPGPDGEFENGTLIGYSPLGAPEFGRVPIEHFERNASNNVLVHSFLIRSNSGELTLNLTIAQGFVTLPSGRTLTPMEAELTFEVNHVMNLTNSRLTLQLSLTTSVASQAFSLQNESWDAEHQFSQDEHAVNVTNNAGETPSSTFFAWSNFAEVNGQPSEVGVTGLEWNETSGGYDLYLSYPRTPSSNPEQIDILHDPSLGVVSAAYQSILNRAPPTQGIQPDVPLYVVTVVAAAVIVAGTVFLARRQRKGRE